MAIILGDRELKKLLGSVIINGDESCVRPNAYVLRLGAKGEFKNTNIAFNIGGQDKKGIKLASGHAAGLSSHEQLDFRRETVHKIYPNCDLFAYLSPVTDLSREGITTHTTQVDVGFNGILSWTINNTSNEENQFLFKEKLYRLTIFKLDQDEEMPEKPYEGDYQGKTDYVRSTRKGAPRGMKENEWATSYVDGSPEDHLKNLISSGFPWNILGKQLKAIDGELKTVTEEYSKIYDSLHNLSKEIDGLPKMVEDKINQKKPELVLALGALIFFLVGGGITIFTNDRAVNFLDNFGSFVGIGIMVLVPGLFWFTRKRKK